jgi:hypothetical protein
VRPTAVDDLISFRIRKIMALTFFLGERAMASQRGPSEPACPKIPREIRPM